MEHSMDNRDSTKIIQKVFRSLLPIQALAVGMPAINSLVDSFIVGNFVGTSGLAAIGFAGPLVMCISTISTVLSMGSQLLSGQYLGKGDREGIRKVFTTTILMAICLGGIFTVLSVTMPRQLTTILGASGEVYEMTAGYVRGLGIGMICSILVACLLPFLQLDRAGKVSTVAVAAMAFTNIAGDLVNVFYLKWGMEGVGLATSVSNIVAVAIALGYILAKSKIFRFSMTAFNFGTVKDILHLGFPGFINICFVFRDRVVNHYLFALGGTTAMSAIAVANNITTAMGGLVEAGYSGSARLLSSILVGQRDNHSLRELQKVMVRSIWFIDVAVYVIVFIFAKPMALVFGADMSHIAIYVTTIRFYNLWYLSNIFKTPPMCIYPALGEIRLFSIFQTFNNAIFPIALCVLFGNLLGLNLVASTPCLAELLTICCFVIYYYMKTKRLPESPAMLTYIPDKTVPAEDRYHATLHTTEEAVAVSAEMIDFCKGRGIPSKHAYYCGLAIEEMAVDKIKYGFKDQKKYTIDLRLLCEDGKVTVMFRDDCEQYDPCQWIELYAAEDPSRSIGLKMVSKLSEEMRYVNVLGMNVLTLKM